MFSLTSDIDVKSVPIDLQIKFIELQNDLDLKTKFLSKNVLEFCIVSPKKKISKDFKTCSNGFVCLEVLIFATNFFSKMKYCKSKSRNTIADEHLHDTLCTTISSMEPNIAKCNK